MTNYLIDQLPDLPLGTIDDAYVAMRWNGATYRVPPEMLNGGFIAPKLAADNTTSDSARIQAALDTGLSVLLPTGSIKLTTGLTMSTAGQRLIGAGRGLTKLYPTGSLTMLTVTAAQCSIGELQVNGTNHTSGGTFYLDGANNFTGRGILASAPRDFIYMQECNTVLWDDVWAGSCKGSFTVSLYGEAGVRSDVIALRQFIASGDGVTKPTGFLWNGNAHTVFMDKVGFLNGHGYGIRVRNTPGGTAPALLQGHNVNIEYCDYGLYIEASEVAGEFNIDQLYSFGHGVGDGVNVAASLGTGLLKLSNSRISGCTGWGINCASGSEVWISNVLMSSNTLGNTSGDVATHSVSFEVDGNAYWRLSGSNPIIAFDSNDYMTYDRSGNEFSWVIGGAEFLNFSASLLSVTAPVEAERFRLDGTAYWDLQTSNPVFTFDTNDYESFSRSGNRWTRILGGSLLQGWQAAYSDFAVPVVLPTYTVAGVPAASASPRGLIYVSNETGGAVPAFSDGTNWRRVTDRSVVA